MSIYLRLALARLPQWILHLLRLRAVRIPYGRPTIS